MTDAELEIWESERLIAIRTRLRYNHDNHPKSFWQQIDRLVWAIVDGCIEIDDTDWPENLDLGDLVDKHLVRWIAERNRND